LVERPARNPGGAGHDRRAFGGQQRLQRWSLERLPCPGIIQDPFEGLEALGFLMCRTVSAARSLT
jgi:hypothetical protein